MARQLKKRSLSEGDKAFQWFQGLGAKTKWFQTPSLANIVIASLLHRIGSKNPKERRFLKRTISLLIAAEQIANPSPQAIAEIKAGKPVTPTPTMLRQEELIRGLMRSICKGSVPRLDHDRHTLRDQRISLGKYFDDHPVAPSLSARKYNNWLKEHAQRLYDILSEHPCLCEYRTSFGDITEDTLWNCHGPGDLILILLAVLHRSTPQGVRQALKRSPAR